MSKANALRWRTPWKKLGMKLAGCIWNLKSYSTLTISKKWKSSGLNNHSSFFCCRPLSTSIPISLDFMSAPGLRYRSFTLRENFVRPALFTFSPQKTRDTSCQCLAELRHRLSCLLARVSPPFHYGETLRSPCLLQPKTK